MLTLLLLSVLTDTIRLSEVTVAGRPLAERAVVEQTLDVRALRTRGMLSGLAGSLSGLANVQVKDYGGLGGLKTVDVRSLGASHTGVSVDGVPFVDGRAGQPDLGRLSLGEVTGVRVSAGLGSSALPSASELSRSATVSITTGVSGGAPQGGGAVAGGSFGTLRADMWAAWPMRRAQGYARGEVLSSRGDYPFRVADTSARRVNGDVQERRFTLDVRGSGWQASLRRCVGERGLPGAIVAGVLANGQRRADDTWWLQARREMSLGRHCTALARLKMLHRHDSYHDLDKSHWTFDARYRQRQLYAGLTALWSWPRWQLTAAYDYQLAGLVSDRPNVGHRRRGEHNVGVRLAHDADRWGARAQCSLTLCEGWRSVAAAAEVRGPWVTAWVKRSHRLPTFDELHYGQVGVPQLRPERARQLGLTAGGRAGQPKHFIEAHADAFLARVADKIMAWPTGQLYRWTMLNAGRVRVAGLAARVNVGTTTPAGLTLTLRAQYTRERSRPDSDNQTAYTPRNSGAAALQAAWHGWSLAASALLTGQRWAANDNRADNRLKPWQSLDAQLAYRRTIGHAALTASFNADNLTGHNYQIIRNFPMPGRTLMAAIEVKL